MQWLVESAAVFYFVGALLGIAVFTAWVIYDRRRNHTPWNWLTYGTRLPLVFAFWPLALIVCVNSFHRNPQEQPGETVIDLIGSWVLPIIGGVVAAGIATESRLSTGCVILAGLVGMFGFPLVTLIGLAAIASVLESRNRP